MQLIYQLALYIIEYIPKFCIVASASFILNIISRKARSNLRKRFECMFEAEVRTAKYQSQVLCELRRDKQNKSLL